MAKYIGCGCFPLIVSDGDNGNSGIGYGYALASSHEAGIMEAWREAYKRSPHFVPKPPIRAQSPSFREIGDSSNAWYIDARVHNDNTILSIVSACAKAKPVHPIYIVIIMPDMDNLNERLHLVGDSLGVATYTAINMYMLPEVAMTGMILGLNDPTDVVQPVEGVEAKVKYARQVMHPLIVPMPNVEHNDYLASLLEEGDLMTAQDVHKQRHPTHPLITVGTGITYSDYMTLAKMWTK